MDYAAAWKIAVPMAVSRAKAYGLTPDEMTSVAGFAVMRAARLWRPEKAGLSTYLHRAIHTEAIEYVRELHPKGRPAIPVVADDTAAAVVTCRQPTPYTAAETRDTLDNYRRAVPQYMRTTLSMLADGYNKAEIGRSEGVWQGTIAGRMREARKYLTAAGLAA